MSTIWIPKRLVEIGLINTAANDIEALVNHCEVEYESRVYAAAQEAKRSGCSIVMLTGPSASGKTTSSLKICEALKKDGTDSVVISLDNFYKELHEYPRFADGSKDYENIHALDVEEIHNALDSIVNKGYADVPSFDFKSESRTGDYERIELDNGIAIVEGIHALNPILSEPLPDGCTFKVYAGLREEYSLGGHRHIATRDVRLARRSVRDNNFRGHSLEKTVDMWPMVCQGEDQYIKRFKPYADFLLDTSFSYEICMLAPFIMKMQGTLGNSTSGQLIDDLAKRFSHCKQLSADYIPEDSMLREFMG